MPLTRIDLPFFHRTEDAIFFVFDNDRLQDENDFVEDGILYFSPFAVGVFIRFQNHKQINE